MIPAEFLVERGGEAFRELMAGAVDALEHKIRVATRGIDLVRESHKANQALEEILRYPLPRSAAGNAGRFGSSRSALSRLAREFRLDIADVRERFCIVEGRRAKTPARPISVDGSDTAESTYRLADFRLARVSCWNCLSCIRTSPRRR